MVAVFLGRRESSSGPAMPLTAPVARRGATWLAAVAASATALFVSAPANVAEATGPSSSYGIQAGTLSAKIVATAHQLDALASATTAADSRLATANAQLVADQDLLTRLEKKLANARRNLRVVAVNAYMESGDDSLVGPWSSPNTATSSAAYEQISLNNQSNAIDGFIQSRSAATAAEIRVRQVQAEAQIQYDTLTHERAVLESDFANEQAMLAKIQQQQAAAAAAAAATDREGPPVAVTFVEVKKAAPAPLPTSSPPNASSTTSTFAATTQPLPIVTSPPTTASSQGSSGGSLSEDMARLRQCESGDNYQANTGNGYYGAYQFSLATWQGLGYGGLPSNAPPSTQDQAAIKLYDQAGWSAWPLCSAILGL